MGVDNYGPFGGGADDYLFDFPTRQLPQKELTLLVEWFPVAFLMKTARGD
jgi:fructose-1,6-bisphosphatase